MQSDTDRPQPRSPILAAFLSGLIPGLGQLYNRQLLKAGAFVAGALLTTFGPVSPVGIDIDLGNPEAEVRRLALASLPVLLVSLWFVIDAYRVARRTRAPR